MPGGSAWAQGNRTQLQEDGLKVEVDEFDAAMVGPWMDLWDIDSHAAGKHNRHTERYLASPEAVAASDARYSHW